MRYFFGDFEFNEGGHHILCRGEEVHVRPKVLALLGRLIRERGRIVPKRELKESLWPGIAVGATSLSTLLGETRAAIGDSGARQQMIRTECGRPRHSTLTLLVGPSCERYRQPESGE